MRGNMSGAGGGGALTAYDYVLKCVHLFTCSTRGVRIGVTERAYYFRRNARYDAAASPTPTPNSASASTIPEPQCGPVGWRQRSGFRAGQTEWLHRAADVLLEIGTEELPSGDLAEALDQLNELVPAVR